MSTRKLIYNPLHKCSTMVIDDKTSSISLPNTTAWKSSVVLTVYHPIIRINMYSHMQIDAGWKIDASWKIWLSCPPRRSKTRLYTFKTYITRPETYPHTRFLVGTRDTTFDRAIFDRALYLIVSYVGSFNLFHNIGKPYVDIQQQGAVAIVYHVRCSHERNLRWSRNILCETNR